jgi:hypothetical protein
MANDWTGVQQLLTYKSQLTGLQVQNVTGGVSEVESTESSLDIKLLDRIKKAGRAAIGSYIKRPLLVI